jgi:hypothetical protein
MESVNYGKEWKGLKRETFNTLKVFQLSTKAQYMVDRK